MVCHTDGSRNLRNFPWAVEERALHGSMRTWCRGIAAPVRLQNRIEKLQIIG